MSERYAPRIGESVRVKASLDTDTLPYGRVQRIARLAQQQRTVGIVQNHTHVYDVDGYVVRFGKRQIVELYGDEIEPASDAENALEEITMLRALLTSAVYGRVVVDESGRFEARLESGELVIEKRQEAKGDAHE